MDRHPRKVPSHPRAARKPQARQTAAIVPAGVRYYDTPEFARLNERWQEACTRAYADPYDDAAWAALEPLGEEWNRFLRRADPVNNAAREKDLQARDAAYPPDFTRWFLKLRRRDPDAVETCVQFLEKDGFAHGTGYAKAEVIYYLNKMPLDEAVRDRLRKVVVNVAGKADGRREFRWYCRLARHLDSPELRAELRRLAGQPVAGPGALVEEITRKKRFARWMLEAVERGGGSEKPPDDAQ